MSLFHRTAQDLVANATSSNIYHPVISYTESTNSGHQMQSTHNEWPVLLKDEALGSPIYRDRPVNMLYFLLDDHIL
jgi:hypothetical protein